MERSRTYQTGIRNLVMSHLSLAWRHILIRAQSKSTFGVHDTLGLRYIFQSRMNLSPLRNYKTRHNFADTPSEICECNQNIEDTSHFYATRIAKLAVKVIEILQRNSLNHLGNQLELYLSDH